jgi:regulator of replication initiation timing
MDDPTGLQQVVDAQQRQIQSLSHDVRDLYQQMSAMRQALRDSIGTLAGENERLQAALNATSAPWEVQHERVQRAV